jgi:hypothetical protein
LPVALAAIDIDGNGKHEAPIVEGAAAVRIGRLFMLALSIWRAKLEVQGQAFV